MSKILQEIYNDNWIDLINKMPIAFAQVREDVLIDQKIVDQLPKNSFGVMIASGGCNSSYLAHSEKFSRLTLVDINQSQIALNKLKFRLVEKYNQHDKLAILGHTLMEPKIRNDILLEELNKLNYDPNILGPINFVSELGPDYVGRYELLFRRLQYEIDEQRLSDFLLNLNDLDQQKFFLSNQLNYKSKLRLAFNSVMKLDNLVKIFGNEATQNMVIPFAEHFYLRTIEVIENIPNLNNPYLSQLLSSKFSGNNYYPWINLEQKPIDTEICYHMSSMIDALLASNDRFDFIHLSNILDWLTEKQATELLQIASEKLTPNGFIIIRQLNSKLDISKLCASLKWDLEEAESLHKQDRSFFYQKLYIGRK